MLKPGGSAYISVPIGRPRTQFNGQRVFDVGEVLAIFAPLVLREVSMVNARGAFHENADPQRANIAESGTGLDYGLGMFVFSKPGGS